MEVNRDLYADHADGKVEIFTFSNGKGMSAAAINYGATLVSCKAPDRNGNSGETLIFFDTFEDYLKKGASHGAIVGRFANRVAGGKIVIDGHEYQLPITDWGRPNCLHGGVKPWSTKIWKGEEVQTDSEVGVRFTLVSPDGDEGFPGKVTATVTYTLTSNNELKMYYEARTDKDTHINLTNHGYWNISGDHAASAKTEEVQLFASQYLPVDQYLVPTGEYKSVEGTTVDLRTTVNVGDAIAKHGDGFDTCFVVDKTGEGEGDPKAHKAAILTDKASGRVMTVLTSEPGVQVYNYNHASEAPPHEQFYGICFEAQHFPDSPNKPHFPTTLLKAGDVYRQLTIHRFTTC